MPPTPNAQQAAGTALIAVLRGQGRGASPVLGATVELVPSDGSAHLHKESDRRGVARFEGLQAGAEYTPAVVMVGTRIEGKPFVMPDGSGVMAGASLQWESGVKTAVFSAMPWGPGKVYIARVRTADAIHYTPPFPLPRFPRE